VGEGPAGRHELCHVHRRHRLPVDGWGPRRVLEAIRAGVTLSSLDETAHRVLGEAGYDRYFPHRVGHGLGIEGHEVPSVVTGNATVTSPGLTFTVEPGIYIPDLGGVRVEENVAVTKDGVDVLTAYPRELRSI
jgi:Xaa-Pro dipeptidase